MSPRGAIKAVLLPPTAGVEGLLGLAGLLGLVGVLLVEGESSEPLEQAVKPNNAANKTAAVRLVVVFMLELLESVK